jgi:glycosyltransferase involved in cell wall biosynthesis
LKILFLLTQSLEYPSGLGRYWPLAKELARLGHDVFLAALHPALAEQPIRTFVQEGVHVHYAGPMHVRQKAHQREYFGPLGLGWSVLRGTWGLSWSALLSRVDVVHVCKPHPQNGLAGLLGKWLRGLRLYLDCDDYEAESNRYSHRWQKQAVIFWEDRLPHLARGITVNTRFTQQRLEALGIPADRIVYVPNGIDRERFSNPDPARITALRAQLGLEGRPVILYVGSLSSPSHPLDLLLQAFVHVIHEKPTARLLIVGGGEDYTALRRQVNGLALASSVVMTGRVAPDQVPDYYRLSDISVDPVHDDPTARARSPLKLFESMATGVPVITGDVGDRREHLAPLPGRAGLLVAPGSAEALAEGLLSLLQNPDQREAMGHHGQRLAEHYFWDVQVHQFSKVYAL